MKKITLFIIKIYKIFFSKWMQGCRFTPTCSDYTYQAVLRYGTIRGLLIGTRRILRCHPFSCGGVDPVK